MRNGVVGCFISSVTTNTGFHKTKVKIVGKPKNFTNCSPNEIGLDGKVNFHNFCKKKSQAVWKPPAPWFDFLPECYRKDWKKVLSFIFWGLVIRVLLSEKKKKERTGEERHIKGEWLCNGWKSAHGKYLSGVSHHISYMWETGDSPASQGTVQALNLCSFDFGGEQRTWAKDSAFRVAASPIRPWGRSITGAALALSLHTSELRDLLLQP